MRGDALWLCECECGTLKTVRGNSLRAGTTQSCGCSHKEKGKKCHYKHGMCNSKTYRAWASMKRRCYRQDDHHYGCYGGRGIKVCERWLNSFENFVCDMGECPEGFSLDRIDVNGDYEPSNCRWTDIYTQSNNKRNNVYLEYKGERKTISVWAKELRINRNTLYSRIHQYKWDIEKAFSVQGGSK